MVKQKDSTTLPDKYISKIVQAYNGQIQKYVVE
jgi:hypothetical protein